MAELLEACCEKKSEAYTCPMTQFVNLISGKWAILILYRLIVFNTPVRFGDLLRAAAPITQKELTKQLRLFEQRGLVTRTVYPEIPPRVEYQITELGLTLQDALSPLAAWMSEYGDQLQR
ncbi:winged helix-turn-helix transcriptional regulator [Enterobacter hormaechei]|uniref:winged helix-turn-helix transcriptional regulator n=1 Tax=Enterobacter hormaechei TaxID=158836 RepID=UPI002076220B|nr:winged helix-turn-helix transcriptional regulator [Enterobacter hormaechei]MCM6969182.1 helix-turn-helix transcriptional regulator [Enterobacter hormaechei]MCM7949707.1 helix-turn-helix transcriptional regulator [Enterobacter hormaechei]MCM7959083.1 helix-turn-helix transcriptional regulator [Enterobacter hormaechei]MCM7987239.1 helix-turn-helix transcriptional regulator [Enterobacter hormaechei]MCM7996867.1 helix-turn-helix transcriptional regulator [Enterobacter hormaechei]